MDQDPDRRQELTVEITVDASAYRRKLAEAMESVTEEDIAAVANRIANRIANVGPAAGGLVRILDRYGYLWEVGIDPPPDPIPDPEIPAAVAYAGLAVALVLVALLAA